MSLNRSIVSQCLLDASHCNDLKTTFDCISDRFIDFNFVGAVCLKQKHCTNEVRVEYEELKTNVTGLFLPVHAGTVILIRKPMLEADTFQLAFILSHTKEFAKALADTIQMAFPKAKLKARIQIRDTDTDTIRYGYGDTAKPKKVGYGGVVDFLVHLKGYWDRSRDICEIII
ncbi:hypothetical protein HYC85_005033 [Camellia sinensis]|uniref:Uncharacterized protein n=1 Tax=Camellia sinensis TaxID=4442 RepID=A0A7J7I128_CAMSI|nr:hypothetical protein HYC85_005033 [Camellia sinensis]